MGCSDTAKLSLFLPPLSQRHVTAQDPQNTLSSVQYKENEFTLITPANTTPTKAHI